MTDRIKGAGFSALQKVRWAEFDLMLAFAHGDIGSLRTARRDVADALSVIDAALAQEEGAKE